MAGKTKVWFTPYEMMDLGFLAGSGSRVQSFHAFTTKLGWSRPEYEYTLWHWASRGGQRRKLWHLGRCREFLIEHGSKPPLPRDPLWKTVPELALLNAPALTVSDPSIRARLKALRLDAARRGGKTWRFRTRGDARQPAKEFLVPAIVDALLKAWRLQPASSGLEMWRREETLDRLRAV